MAFAEQENTILAKQFVCCMRESEVLVSEESQAIFAVLSNAPKTPESTDRDAIEAFILHHQQFHEEWLRNQCRFDVEDMESL